MNIESGLSGESAADEGASLYQLVTELFPICRSITGDGFRRSLELLRQQVPLERHEVPTGARVFDWTIPREWNIRDAWIQNARGERVVDFQSNNLHVLGYSLPVRAEMTFAELRPHLFTLPQQPDWIPYRTSYYKEAWGFCISQRQLEEMERNGGKFDVCIDSSLEPGQLTYGEYFKPGENEDEILFSCHACHPSLANDNLSGMAVTAGLARRLSSKRTRYSYRFVWIPGTIGALAWLARNEEKWSRIRMGLVVSCVGDRGGFTYKKSRRGDAMVDRVMRRVLEEMGTPFRVQEFTPLGYDERQYCSPGIDLPVGCFMRTPNGQYPEYHTSADDLQLVAPEPLNQSLAALLSAVQMIEADRRYLNLSPKGEPQLGRRGLYSPVGGGGGARNDEALLWVLSFSDGRHSLLDIAERSGIRFSSLAEAAKALTSSGLLKQQPANDKPGDAA